ncbi:MAG: pilus assembly protein [Deltaproteobacteria bacterium]|nr:pilus assembly protein [Deltaproteobacteria bacterium]
MNKLKRQRGQAAVETAIVMPLNIFLLLSIIQFGLISQARYMAKYAAYRAARVGSMQHADKTKMLAAAQAAVLPVLAMPSVTWLTNASNPGAMEVIQPTNNFSSVMKKTLLLKLNNTIPPGMDFVKVVVCGPLKDDVTNITEESLNSNGSSSQVDFDDPRATLDLPSGWSPQSDLKKFLATKLRVQVQLNYVMPIPFANWIISRAYLAMTVPEVLRMGSENNPWGPYVGSNLWLANQMHIYIAPIFENYAMRMQSNLYLKGQDTQLPSENECVSFAKANDNK